MDALTPEQLEEWRGVILAGPQPPFAADDDADMWRLFSSMCDTCHGLQMLKAPKHSTPFAEYYPNAQEAAYIVAACNAFPALLTALTTARTALAWYAAETDPIRLAADGGQRARAALGDK